MNSTIPIVQRPPTRLVVTDTTTLPAGGRQSFLGSNARQDRVQFIITNLDVLNSLKVQNMSNRNAATVFPQTNITIETSADLQVYNPNAAGVDFEVTELYPDTGGPAAGAGARPGAAAAGAAGAAGGGAAGGGSYSGGGGGGQSGPGGTQLR